jgi:hypothetical protein
MNVKIPKELVRRGLVWGVAKDELYAYAETKKDLQGVPDEIDGVKVNKRVTGKVRPVRV